MKFWVSLRVGRADFFFGVLAIGVLYLVGRYLLTGQLVLQLDFGFRTQAGRIAVDPAEVTALRIACDLLTMWFVVRRVRDTDHPGWWGFGLVLLPLIFGDLGGLMSLLALIALLFVPGTVGPNRFGPDPRGWLSQDHYDEQQRRLKSGNL